MTFNRTSLTIYFIVVIAVVVTDIVLVDGTRIQQTDIFSIALGLVTVFFFYMNSQRVLSHNQFMTLFLFGLAVFIASLTKQLMTILYFGSLFVAGLPVLFVAYFRGLVGLFFKGYPNIKKQPIIVFASPYSGSAYYDGKDDGYKPTMKEKVFSVLLYIGFVFFALGLLWFFKNILHVV